MLLVEGGWTINSSKLPEPHNSSPLFAQGTAEDLEELEMGVIVLKETIVWISGSVFLMLTL